MHWWHRLNVVAGLSVFTVLGAFAQTPSNPLPLAIHSSDELIDVSFGYTVPPAKVPERILFSDVNLSIDADSRVALVGPRGRRHK